MGQQWIHLVVQGNQGKNKALDVLDKVVEGTETFWVVTFLHVQQRANFGSLLDNENQRVEQPQTENEICSLSMTTSSSCFPTLSGSGQLLSSSLRAKIRNYKKGIPTSSLHCQR